MRIAPVRRESWKPGRKPGWLIEYWHLLSLDAPTVAIVWAWSFAHCVHIALPFASLAPLFAGTWLLYVADRILDGLHQERSRLRERHLFYLRHRALAIAASVPVGSILVWLVCFRMLPGVRLEDAVVFSLASAYFLLVHLRGCAIERWFPKELIVALVFAVATAIPAWVTLNSRNHAALALVAALFAALCWLNCIAIEKWEQPRGTAFAAPDRLSRPWNAPAHISDRTARWGQEHLRRISTVLAAAAFFAAALLLRSNPLAAKLCFAAVLSAGLFLLLDRRPFSAFHLRIAADAALLTPLLVLLIR